MANLLLSRTGRRGGALSHWLPSTQYLSPSGNLLALQIVSTTFSHLESSFISSHFSIRQRGRIAVISALSFPVLQMSVAEATEAVASSSISHESVSLHWAPPGLQSNLDILDSDEVLGIEINYQ